jgi:DNA-binding NarL/FixJ family response regulator
VTPAPAPVTVLIGDDDSRVRDALREVIAAQPDFAVVAVAGNGDEAVALAARHRPRVAILDVRMPGGGARTARRILEQCPETRILAFSAHNDKGTIDEMKRAGVSEYLVKGASIQDIAAAVRRVTAPPAA